MQTCSVNFVCKEHFVVANSSIVEDVQALTIQEYEDDKGSCYPQEIGIFKLCISISVFPLYSTTLNF